MKDKKRTFIKSIIVIELFLIFCIVISFCQSYYKSKKLEKNLEQIQIEQEERRKQEQLERQAQQEEQARQENERLEEIRKSLPTKFNLRNKLKITAENQGQKPFCSLYAYVKSIEITLNYQGNYDYDFKKVYKYLKTAPNEIKEESDACTILKDLIGLDNCTYKDYPFDLEDLTLIKNEIVNGRPMLIDINDEMSIKIGGDPSCLGTKYGSGHEMIIIGYDDEKQSWLCLNSWGANWGNNGNGTIWIKYNDENIVYSYSSMFQAIIEQNN